MSKANCTFDTPSIRQSESHMRKAAIPNPNKPNIGSHGVSERANAVVAVLGLLRYANYSES